MAERTKRKKKEKRSGGLLLFLLIIAALLFADSWLRIVTDEYAVPSDRIPEAFDGYRIVQISDLHGRELGKDNARLISAVKKAEPDLIAVTGDLIDSDDQGEMAENILAAFADIAPTYYVTGNHEWASRGLTELWDILDRTGVTPLENKYVLLSRENESIILAGASDPGGAYDMITPDKLIPQIRAEAGDGYLVVLNHRNDRLGLYTGLGADLVLCGHAHGGIIRLPFTDGLYGPGREFFPAYTSGLYSRGDTDMVVSRGFGGPIRLFNNPQVSVAVLQRT